MASDADTAHVKTVDVGSLLDERPWSGYQLRVVMLTALAVVMDGLDNRLLPLAIPPLLKEWGAARDAFALATSVGLIGMALGTAIGGMVGDRIGRRPTIVGSSLAFGLLTLVNAFVGDVPSLIAIRFLAGLGLGALMPASAAMIAEVSPARHKALAVTFGMACIPIGGTLSGLLGAAVLPAPGWRALFLIGGGVATAIGAIQWFALPESPRFLSRRPARQAELRAIMGRMACPLPPDIVLTEEVDEAGASASLSRLFAKGLVRDTLGLWIAFFAILMCLYMESQWTPTLLTSAGYGIKVASIASSCLAFGGIFACIIGVAAVSRFGSRRALMGMAAAGVLLTLGLTQYPADPARSVLPLLVLLTIAGFLIGGLQIMIYSVATHVYPTALRATGIGWAVGIGRLGSVLSPFIATSAIAMGGWQSFFLLLAVGLAVTFAALGLVRRHVPPRERLR